jgi:hypothetical protein
MMLRLTVFFLAILPVVSVSRAEAPRYRWQPNQQFAYDVQVTADLPDKVETLSGRIVYRVRSTGEPLKISYQGGLAKSAKNKPSASSRPGPFGPPGFFAPPPPGPFDRPVNPFQGLTQTSNEITLTSQGEVQAMEGSSQLPYLLGNLSLLVFEPLPESDQPSWKVESGVTIAQKAERSRGFGPFGDPFFRPGNDKDKTRAGEDSTSFTLNKEMGQLVSYQKTYRLHSPGDEATITIDGNGTWTFNRQLGMSESLDFNQKISIQRENVSLAIPVTVKYRRMSDEEWAKLEQERMAAETAKREEAERKAAEAKAKADAPIAGAERQQVLATLASGGANLEATLKMLAGKTPRSDEELAKAIERYTNHPQSPVRDLARKALAAFSPAYKGTHDLNLAYQGNRAVKQLGLWVSYDTPLPAGLIVAANRFGYAEDEYFPAEVIGPVGDSGLVKVKYLGGGSFTEERLREDMFLPPPEVDQPKLSQEQRAALDGYRGRVQSSLGSSPAEIQANEQLNRAYRDTKTPLPKTGSPLPEGVRLPKFFVVAAQKDDGQWYQAHVHEELPDGRFSLRFSGERWDAKLPRTKLRLPPPEVASPNNPPVVSSGAAVASSASPEFRTWTDSSGKFRVQAKFVADEGGNVRLVREDGKEFTVPAARLSAADRQYLQSLRTANSDNPFPP